MRYWENEQDVREMLRERGPTLRQIKRERDPMKLRCPVIVKRVVPGTKYQKERVHCGQEAKLYEVWGESFCARQELCAEHADKAKKEGFKLFEIGVDNPRPEEDRPPTGS